MTDTPFLPAARAELLRAARRYERERPGLGKDFVAEAEAVARRIAIFPAHGSSYLYGTRRVLLNRFPFSLVYRLEGNTLLIVAVAHQRRRPGYWGHRVEQRPEG